MDAEIPGGGIGRPTITRALGAALLLDLMFSRTSADSSLSNSPRTGVDIPSSTQSPLPLLVQ